MSARDPAMADAPVHVKALTAAASACRSWPLVAELFCADAARDWDWEGIRVGGKLHLYCYLSDGVVALAPFEIGH
jgi:hypothetical protein